MQLFFGIMLFSNSHAHLLLFSKVSFIIPKFSLIMLKFIQNKKKHFITKYKNKVISSVILQHDTALNVVL